MNNTVKLTSSRSLNTKMKAIVYNQYGGPEVLKMQEVEKPQPKENEVLVRIYTTTATPTDHHFRMGKPFSIRLFFGFFKPKYPVLGNLFAGEIEAVGESITNFKVGDRIFGSPGNDFGTYAEYKCVAQDGMISKIPDHISYDEIVGLPEGMTALHFFTEAIQVKKGQKILIIGASGAVGSFAVQIATYLGAEVTGVCSTRNLELVRSLGAKHVIDYTNEDFSQNGEKYDLIFHLAGDKTFAKSKNSLTENGIYMSAVLNMNILVQSLITSLFGKKKARIEFAGLNQKKEHFLLLRDLINEGKLVSIIDRVYNLSEMVEAHEYVSKGHKRGNVVIRV